MTGGDGFDAEIAAVREAYRDVHLPVALADITRGSRRAEGKIFMVRTRTVLAAATAVAVLLVGGWWLVGRSGDVPPGPAQPSPSPSVKPQGKPPRPSTAATTDQGKCADYQAHSARYFDAREQLPPLRFALKGPDPLRVRFYADEASSVICWLTSEPPDGEVIDLGGSQTAINDVSYPAGKLSYGSEDSGRGWGGVAYGRVPPGTTKVTISFPSGPDVTAQLDGEWFIYFAAPPDNERLAEVTKVTAQTPDGPVTQRVEHG